VSMGVGIETRPSVTGARLRYTATGLAFAAELTHLWAFAHEFAVFPTRGLPLLPVAAVQGMLAVGLLFGAGRWTIGFGIVFNLAVALGWAFTRVVGIPFGGVLVRMPVGLLDLVATATEVALVAALVVMLADAKPKLPSRG
jgi:hypothetical protein